MARNTKTDLQSLLPGKPTLRIIVTDDPATVPARAPNSACLLFSPRVWGELEAHHRRDQRGLEVRYVFDPVELETLGRELRLPRRRPAAAV